MKGKITGLVLCLMFLCMSVLTGCSLVETNYDRYYNQVVAVVENKETKERAEITKREFLQSYQSYGYNYVQYYNYSQQDAMKMTIERLENRKIVYLAARKEFNVGENEAGLSEKEKTYLFEQTLDTIKDNLNSYYNDLVKTDESSSTDSDVIKFNGYTKNAELGQDADGYHVIKKNQTDDLMNGFTYQYAKDIYNENNFNSIYESLIDMLSNNNYKRAFDRYFRDLRLSENGQNLSRDQKSVFEREIKRIYNVLLENYLISKYTNLNKNVEGVSAVSASQIVGLYASKARASYTQYVIEKDSNYVSNVQSAPNDVYYFINDSDTTKFFTVANILFKFDENQEKEYKRIKAKYDAHDGGYSYTDYQADLNDLYSKVAHVTREYNSETGNYDAIESDLTVEEVCQQLSQALESAKLEGINKVGDTINEYIYMYNEDPGMFNATNNYVIGVDKDGNAVSNFVEAFNEAGLALYNGGRGEIGDVSALVRTEYGLHLLIYTGACTNLFDGINSGFELNDDAIETLYSTRVNLLVDKTYFDVLYDEIYTDNFSVYENANMNFMREQYNIVEYSGRYSNLSN